MSDPTPLTDRADREPEAPIPPPPRPAGLLVARVAAATLLVGTALLVLRPFLVPLAWGAILAYATWPLYLRFPGRARFPGVSAAALVAILAIGLGVPVALLLINLADEASQIARSVIDWQQAGATLPEAFAESALMRRLAELWQGLPFLDPNELGKMLARSGSEVSRQLVAVASGVARNALKFGVAMVSLYAFYISGESLIAQGRRLAPLLFPTAPARFIESIGESVRAVMFGLLGTALAQGTLAGLGLAVAGIPSPVALGAATVLTSVLPGGGSAITFAAAAWLAFTGHWGAAVGLALWAGLVVGSMDNLLRPLLISGRGRIPFLLVFLGILGGLLSFGLIGIFIGPVILSVAFTLVDEFSRMPLPRHPAHEPPAAS